MNVADKSFHRDCFKCYKCRDGLVVKYFVHGGQPFCEGCYKMETCPSCCVCGHIVDGDGVKIGKDDIGGEKIYHTHCVRYQHLHPNTSSPSPSRCGVCNDIIHGKIITVDDKFVCSCCAKHVRYGKVTPPT